MIFSTNEVYIGLENHDIGLYRFRNQLTYPLVNIQKKNIEHGHGNSGFTH
jgi:hypothetical protein